MKFFKDKYLWLVISVGLLLRIALNNIVYSRDADSFIIWARYLTTHRISDLYVQLPFGYLPYPPFYYYVLRIVGGIGNFFDLWGNVWLSYLLVKIPPITADAVSTFIIYWFANRFISKKAAIIGSAFFFLHPAIVYNTSVWGQIDSVIIFFGLLSLILIIQKKILLGLFVFLLGMLTKLQTLAVAPLVAALYLTGTKFKQLIFYAFSIVPLGLLIFSPLLLQQGIRWNLSYFLNMPNQYPYTSVYAYNLWAPVGFIVSDKSLFLSLITYKLLGLLIYLTTCALIIFPFLKKENRKPKLIMYAAFLLFFAFAFFNTRIHSRYLIYSLGFFAPFALNSPVLAFGLSFLMIANLMLPLNYPALAPVVSVLRQPLVIWAFVVFGFLLFVAFYKKYTEIIRSPE